MKPCVLIPTYDNPRTLEAVVRGALAQCPDVVVVDDGSAAETREILAGIEGIHVHRHPHNRGKGAALRSGFAEALRLGYTHAIALDSDGQHLPQEIPRFLAAAREHPQALIIGDRDMEAGGAGPGSKFGLVNSNFWTWVIVGQRLPDTQSGFRCYPLEAVGALELRCTGYDLEIEVLVKAAWSGTPLRSIPISVRYFRGEERVSHLHPVWDFIRIGRLNARFVTQRICLPTPYLQLRCSRRFHAQGFVERWRETFRDLILREPGSPARLAASVGLGLFWAVAPVWGFQMILALLSAHLLRLSKPVALLASNVSFPLLIPGILYAALVLGRFLLGVPEGVPSAATLELQPGDLPAWVVGSLTLGLLLALLGAGATFLAARGLRRARESEGSAWRGVAVAGVILLGGAALAAEGTALPRAPPPELAAGLLLAAFLALLSLGRPWRLALAALPLGGATLAAQAAGFLPGCAPPQPWALGLALALVAQGSLLLLVRRDAAPEGEPAPRGAVGIGAGSAAAALLGWGLAGGSDWDSLPALGLALATGSALSAFLSPPARQASRRGPALRMLARLEAARPARILARAALFFACLGLAGGLPAWLARVADPAPLGAAGLALLLVIPAWHGRPEPPVFALAPLGLGAAASLGLLGWLEAPATSAAQLGVLAGLAVSAQQASLLNLAGLETWRRERDTRWPTRAALLPLPWGLGAGALLLAGGTADTDLAAFALAGACALGLGSLTVWLFVPLLQGAALRLRGPNGTPGPFNVLMGVWVIGVLVGRGLWFIVARRPFLTPAERPAAARQAIHRIYKHIVERTPTGSRRVLGATLENLGSQPGVLVANHTSVYDIGAVCAFPVPMAMVVKEWVWRTPVLGTLVRDAQFINADRCTAEEMIQAARALVEQGIWIAMFPEGTRAQRWRIGRFRNGAFALARALGVRVVPVAIANGRDLSPPGTWWIGFHRTQVEVLEALDPADFAGELGDRAMARAARDRIRAACRAAWPGLQQGPGWHRPLASIYRFMGPIISHYAASKMKRDPLVRALPELVPPDGELLVAGCGYGLMTARLACAAPWRSIRAVDFDPRKVAVARTAFGEQLPVEFVLGDLREVELGRPEAALLVDVLHYWPRPVQRAILARLAAALPPGGLLLFRDGLRDAGGHGLIRRAERLAGALGFTRMDGLHFASGAEYEALLAETGFAVSSAHPELGLSSNRVLLCRRLRTEEEGASEAEDQG